MFRPIQNRYFFSSNVISDFNAIRDQQGEQAAFYIRKVRNLQTKLYFFMHGGLSESEVRAYFLLTQYV